MRLFQSPASPYARKVRVVLQETGLADSVVLEASKGSPLDPSGMPTAHNPLGKIPTLARDDGPALFDSRVICRYLDDRASGGLYPAPSLLWQSLTLESLADGIIDAAILMVYEGRLRPAERQSPEWVEGQWAKVARALDALEEGWLAHLAGPLDIGQIALACALGYLDFRHHDRDWRRGRDGLAAWEAGIAARESLRTTVPTD